MKIQICSDLHLEFADNRAWLKENPLIPKTDILLIAGDTYYLERTYRKMDFIKRVSRDFKQVYLIPGNHEYYGGYDISTALEPTHEELMENVFMVNNKVVEIEDVQFIFSTMWSRIEHHILEIMRGMVDFRKIKYKGERFTVNHFNEIHEAAFNFISNAVKSPGKKVVMTHHLPSNECNVKEFRGSLLNDAFCVEKTNFIQNSDIDLWIYGHSHRNLNDFKIGNTKLVTNQLGYVSWNEHLTFDRGKVVDF